MNEVATKVSLLREIMTNIGIGAVRFRGTDWYSWLTAGGSNVVLLTAETGVADILVTKRDVVILTDRIEAKRIEEEECGGIKVLSSPWQNPEERELVIKELAGSEVIVSDHPHSSEVPLPLEVCQLKRRLLPEEIDRYRELGQDAAKAMTEALKTSRPDWTEFELAAQGAKALWARGIHPALILVAGASRIDQYRHPVATSAPLGRRAMMVFCARRYGLYANLTRFVYFQEPTKSEERLKKDLAIIESQAWLNTKPQASLGQVYKAMVKAYEELGYNEEPNRHHQGGITGYLAREEIAGPNSMAHIEANMAFAWNPSLTGAKAEDTILVKDDNLEILTVDPDWPSFNPGIKWARPDYLVRP